MHYPPQHLRVIVKKCYTLNSAICHHGQSMKPIIHIKHQYKWVRCKDTHVQFERWPRGAKELRNNNGKN